MYPNVLLHIDGKWTESASKKTLEVMNPATGEVNGLLSHAGIPDLDRALEATERGFATWRKVSAFDRSKLLRKAAEQRVMLVFVIVDSLQQGLSKTAPAASSGTSTPSGADAARNSILSMSSVSYTTNAATGKLELKMERYLDSFPFEYFVVVRDVDALPDVLAATLRQWAERIRDS